MSEELGMWGVKWLPKVTQLVGTEAGYENQSTGRKSVHLTTILYFGYGRLRKEKKKKKSWQRKIFGLKYSKKTALNLIKWIAGPYAHHFLFKSQDSEMIERVFISSLRKKFVQQSTLINTHHAVQAKRHIYIITEESVLLNLEPPEN